MAKKSNTHKILQDYTSIVNQPPELDRFDPKKHSTKSKKSEKAHLFGNTIRDHGIQPKSTAGGGWIFSIENGTSIYPLVHRMVNQWILGFQSCQTWLYNLLYDLCPMSPSLIFSGRAFQFITSSRYAPNLTWKVVPICDHAVWVIEWHWFGALLGCAGLSSVFSARMQAVCLFLQKDVETNPSLRQELVPIFSRQINSSTIMYSHRNMFRIQPQNCRPRHMDFTSRRCCHRESLAWFNPMIWLKILPPQKTDGWKSTLHLQMMMCWCLPVPSSSCSFLMSVIQGENTNRSNVGESLKPKLRRKMEKVVVAFGEGMYTHTYIWSRVAMPPPHPPPM